MFFSSFFLLLYFKPIMIAEAFPFGSFSILFLLKHFSLS
jgi:hypothetical protein